MNVTHIREITQRATGSFSFSPAVCYALGFYVMMLGCRNIEMKASEENFRLLMTMVSGFAIYLLGVLELYAWRRLSKQRRATSAASPVAGEGRGCQEFRKEGAAAGDDGAADREMESASLTSSTSPSPTPRDALLQARRSTQ